MFPRLDSSKKDKDYHVAWGRAILTSSITDDWSMKYRVMAECYKFFQSGSSGELTSFLQKAADGSDMPAMWLTMSSLKSKIEVLVGELEERGYDIRVRALNKEATSRKLDEKERLRVERRLQNIARFATAETGLPVQKDTDIPQSDAELDEKMDSYKDKAEIIVETALKYCNKREDFDDTRVKWFKDVWIAGKIFARNQIVRGMPESPRVDPLAFIYDRHCVKDDLSDSTFFGEVYYMPLGQAAERFNLTKDELETANNAYNQFVGMTSQLMNTPQTSNQFFDSIPNATLGWFKNVDNIPRVLVCRTVWSDFKIRKYKNEVNTKYGTEHLQEITDEVRNRGKSPLITSKMNVWRQVTLIGGTIVREWGECPNQARELSSLEMTEPPYKCWVPNYFLSSSVSKTEQVVGIELLRDIAAYNLQLAMNRSAGKVVAYDIAMKPENMTFEQVMGYAKTGGFIPVNSKEYQMMSGGMKIMDSYDLTMSGDINKFLEIMAFLDSQVDTILGTSPERQGNIPVASQAVGVTQAAVAGSNLVTAPYFKGFERFCSRVLNQKAKFIKIAWANSDKELFAPIIGDAGIDFLKDNIDIDLDEFNVWVESLPPLLRDRDKLENLVTLAVQSGTMEIQDALAILMEPDLKIAVRKLMRKAALRKMMEAQQAQAEQQQEAALQEKMKAADMQNQQMLMQNQQQLQAQKNQGNMQKTLATGQVKLSTEKIKALTQ